MSRFARCALLLCRASAVAGSRSRQFTGDAHARLIDSSTRTGATISCSHSASSSDARQDEDIAYRSRGVLQKEVRDTLLTMTFVKGIADSGSAPAQSPAIRVLWLFFFLLRCRVGVCRRLCSACWPCVLALWGFPFASLSASAWFWVFVCARPSLFSVRGSLLRPPALSFALPSAKPAVGDLRSNSHTRLAGGRLLPPPLYRSRSGYTPLTFLNIFRCSQ